MTPAAASPLLVVDQLGMRFGGQVVFEDLSFSSAHGALALVGPNGSGKSTLIALLCGIETPHAGRIRIAGHDMQTQPRQAKAQLAYVPDDSVAYDFMRGSEFLAMVDALRGRRDADGAASLVAGFGLAPHLGTRFAAMSLGTRKKFMLLAGLMCGARVTVMDEPTNGIDAGAKAFLGGLIEREAGGRLFVFSTHDEALIAATGAQRLSLPHR